MNTIAEFTIIGRVGEIKQVGTTLRVSVASSYSRKDNRGEWVERTRWNEVTVFGESSRGYVKRNIVKGDLVFTSGSMGQTKWEKDGGGRRFWCARNSAFRPKGKIVECSRCGPACPASWPP